jgi:hypothetical protein
MEVFFFCSSLYPSLIHRPPRFTPLPLCPSPHPLSLQRGYTNQYIHGFVLPLPAPVDTTFLRRLQHCCRPLTHTQATPACQSPHDTWHATAPTPAPTQRPIDPAVPNLRHPTAAPGHRRTCPSRRHLDHGAASMLAALTLATSTHAASTSTASTCTASTPVASTAT